MALQNHSFLDMFDLPLSNIAFEEYHNLKQLLNLHLQDSTNDSWHYHWVSSYSVSKACATLMQSVHPPLAFQWTWKTCCQKKHKVFSWLLLKDRLSTKDILFRINFFLSDNSCIMCNDHVIKSRDHLFFHYKFARECWNYMCQGWHIRVTSSQLDCIDKFKHMIKKPSFREIIILSAWAIWKTRNTFIFNGRTPSL
jgi:hypothetical protein